MQLKKYDLDMLGVMLENGMDGLLTAETQQFSDWLDDFRERVSEAREAEASDY